MRHPRKTGEYSKSKKAGLEKGECQYRHAAKRMRERLGIALSEDHYNLLVSCIKNPAKAEERGIVVEFYEEQTNRVHSYKVILPGNEPFLAVYDVYREKIATFLHLPPEGLVTIYRYYDQFGNMRSTKEDFVISPTLDLNTNELTISGLNTTYLGNELIGGLECRKWRTDEGRHLVYLEQERKLSFQVPT